MTDSMHWQLLDKYFSGQSSPAEVEIIGRWAAESSANATHLAEARKVWEMTGVIPEWFDSGCGWETIASRLTSRPRVLTLRPRQHAERIQSARRVRVVRSGLAAAVIVVAALGAWRWARTIGAQRSAGARAIDYATLAGQRGTIVLVDGTRVWLNAASHLRVAARFGSADRDVYLDGEAVFAVEHDPATPFRVHTAMGIVEDVGTEFVVRAYPEDSSTNVVVSAGVVDLRAAARPTDRGVLLRSGQRGRVDRVAYLTVDQEADIDRWMAWRDGRLRFQEVPLADVARELDRWYGVRIELADSTLGGVPVTATFMNQSVEDVMGVVARSIGGRYTRSGSVIRLSVPETERAR
jgi:transmembrane sensor